MIAITVRRANLSPDLVSPWLKRKSGEATFDNAFPVYRIGNSRIVDQHRGDRERMEPALANANREGGSQQRSLGPEPNPDRDWLPRLCRLHNITFIVMER